MIFFYNINDILNHLKLKLEQFLLLLNHIKNNIIYTFINN